MSGFCFNLHLNNQQGVDKAKVPFPEIQVFYDQVLTFSYIEKQTGQNSYLIPFVLLR